MAIDQKENPSQSTEQCGVVAVVSESPGCAGMHATRVHHRNFPELCGEGATPYEAGLALLKHLISQTGAVAEGCKRDALEQVIAEVRAFLDRVA
jgi:hypothetical protein